MLELTDYTLKFPELPNGEEWQHVIEDMDDGITKEATIWLARGYCLLPHVVEQKATPERLGWLGLWSKTIEALSSATTAFQSKSDWMLQAISRSTHEWLLHSIALTDHGNGPNPEIGALMASGRVIPHSAAEDRVHRDTVDRLRAYTAWCLWSDLKYFEWINDRRSMERIWEPVSISQEVRDLHIKLYGRLEIEPEPDVNELRAGRKEMEAFLKKKIKRIRKWLSNPLLQPWSDRINEICRESGAKCPSFFALFGDESTVFSQLRKIGLTYAYALYSGSSMALHGDTLEQFLFIDGAVISPKLGNDEQEAERHFEAVISSCKLIFFKLGWIDQVILSRPELRR